MYARHCLNTIHPPLPLHYNSSMGRSSYVYPATDNGAGIFTLCFTKHFDFQTFFFLFWPHGEVSLQEILQYTLSSEFFHCGRCRRTRYQCLSSLEHYQWATTPPFPMLFVQLENLLYNLSLRNTSVSLLFKDTWTFFGLVVLYLSNLGTICNACCKKLILPICF